MSGPGELVPGPGELRAGPGRVACRARVNCVSGLGSLDNSPFSAAAIIHSGVQNLSVAAALDNCKSDYAVIIQREP